MYDEDTEIEGAEDDTETESEPTKIKFMKGRAFVALTLRLFVTWSKKFYTVVSHRSVYLIIQKVNVCKTILSQGLVF